MRRGWPVFGALAIVTSFAQAVSADNHHASLEDVLHELRQLRSRVQVLEEDRAADRQRIRELQDRVADYEQTVGWRDDSVQAVGSLSGAAAEPTAGQLGQGNLYNPGITAFVDAGGAVSTDGDNKALNRFNLREVELDFRAAINPYVDGVVIVALGEEVDREPDGDIGAIETAVELEETYLNFHTLPYDLQLKAGKFRGAFGRNNLLHTHDLPQITRPLVVGAFLGPEGTLLTGASASWLMPNPWDRYVELTAEVINSDGGEAPLLGGPNADNPAVLTHLKLFEDVGATGSIEVGGSHLYGHTGDRGSDNVNLYGLDLSYQWLDPARPDSRSFLLQSEFFWADNDVLDDDGVRVNGNTSFGAYAFAQYQFRRDWYAGVRGDYTEFPNDEFRGPDDRDWAVSPYVSWYLSEFLRLRFEWQHREFEIAHAWDDEDAFLLQFTYAIGAHPPHPYWVNR